MAAKGRDSQRASTSLWLSFLKLSDVLCENVKDFPEDLGPGSKLSGESLRIRQRTSENFIRGTYGALWAEVEALWEGVAIVGGRVRKRTPGTLADACRPRAPHARARRHAGSVLR